MKKLLLSLFAVGAFMAGSAQTVFFEGFQDDGSSTSENGGSGTLINAVVAPDDADCEVFLNFDGDELPDANDRPGNMYLGLDIFYSTVAGYDLVGDSNFVANSSSWMTGYAEGTMNWLVLPCVDLTAESHFFSWKSGVRQTPRYADGYEVGIVTDVEDLEGSFVPLFQAAQMVEATGWVDGYYDDPMDYTACATASGLTPDMGCWYPSTLGDGTGGTGYMHGDGLTDYVDFFYDGTSETTDVYVGLMEPHTLDLSAYIGQDVRIAILHNSDDDNLIFFDDLEVHSGAQSISEIPFETFVSMYPNPVVDVLNFNFTESVKNNAIINVVDSKGAIVLTEVITDAGLRDNVNIDLGQFSAGIYSVAVTVDNQLTVSKNIVRR